MEAMVDVEDILSYAVTVTIGHYYTCVMIVMPLLVMVAMVPRIKVAERMARIR